ncbi:hypothetical protein SAMN04488542_11555 [Fontibacillus panacisegetis]|uniref:Uncharacterized protein n=1 Tax=Fontibacillus panacisegetis TaxID=670482 RepID=A0A1G7N7W5_9BACL|nr:DUF6809 family protein [Fontibacillus panacisegetis]SDF70155.1 hypothetical protein SAMN04488542_11555 [Fontibacillus panacisegetis]
MKSILDELYRANLKPEERMVPTDPDYRPLNRKISELKEEVKKRLSESDFEVLEQIFDLTGESHSMLTNTAFVQGFRMGALVMVEVFCGEVKSFKE